MHPELKLLIALARILQPSYEHLKELADHAEAKLAALVESPAVAATGNAAADLQALADHVTGGLSEKLNGAIAQLKADVEAGFKARFADAQVELQKSIGDLRSDLDKHIETQFGALLAKALAADAARPDKPAEPAPAA